jgi:hypothetical protein
MDEINPSYKKVRNPDKKNKVIGNKPARTPGNHEYAEGNDDREYFYHTVKKNKTVELREIKPCKYQQPE